MVRARRIVGVLAGLICAAAAWPAESPDDVTITVAEGELVGSARDDIYTFKAIPYAAPPVGVRRWRPPEPAAPWSGQRLATAFGPICMQPAYPPGSVFAGPLPPMSEDCLTLNVWTGAVADDGKRPVMVWLHGGGLTRGSGTTVAYDGTALARKGVVVVTINYRLGAFGFLAHPELSAESPHRSSGNYGVLDQIAALAWIKANIHHFGGDPNNVTIFGESAGARSVAYLTATPLAGGHFHRAIAQSGGAFTPMPVLASDRHGRSSHESVGVRFATAAGATDLAGLRAKTAAEILAVSTAFESERIAEGNADGWVFPESVEAIYRSGRQHAVPLILGFNKDEGTSLTAPSARPRSAEAATVALEAMFGAERRERALALYDVESDPERAWLDAFRDARFGWSMRHWAELATAAGQPVYLYYFTFEPAGPNREQLRAYHAAEIRFAFGNAHVGSGGSSREERKLADVMSDYWTTFAATGTPISAEGATWPRFDPADADYLELAATPKARTGLLDAVMPLLNEVSAAAWSEDADAATTTTTTTTTTRNGGRP